MGESESGMPAGLPMWTIYDHPSDYPRHYVVRATIVGRSVPSERVQLADTLEEARALVPDGLFCLARSPGDDPVIVETWF